MVNAVIQNKLIAGNKPLLNGVMNTGCMRSEESRNGRRYWVAVGTALFKDAEGRNIFTQLPNLSLEEFKQLAPVHFLFPTEYYIFLESAKWKILTGRMFCPLL